MINNTLNIQNFGPIKKANIDISPLTIFIGSNSSGKSFSAMIIHSILNSFDKLGFNQLTNVRNKSLKRFMENNQGVFKEFKESINQYVELKPKISDEPFKFPADKLKYIIEESFGQVYNNLVEEKLKRNFNNNLNKLNQLNKFPFEFSFNDNLFINKSGNLELKDFSFDFNKLKNELIEDDDKICLLDIDDEFLFLNLNYLLWNKFFDDNYFLSEVIFMMITTSLMEILNYPSYYLPAAGDELFKDVNNFIVDDMNGTFKPSLVQEELLTNFIKVNSDMDKSSFYSLARQLENELIDGEIQVKKTEFKEELFFIDNEYGMELELELTSSSIRELTPFIIYLKYFLQKGNTLIIEEPENHLHPKNQLILVKYLVKAINQGLNIIITTHSDFIIEKFNNFIRLGNANDDIFNKLGYDKSNILDFHDVNIYNFKKEDKYSYVASKVDINETGFDENTFFEVSTELYDESVDIIDAEKK